MAGVEAIRRLHQHRRWVNENLLAAAEGLSEEGLRQSLAIGQGSVWKSLLHMFAAEYVWLEALLGNEEAVAPGDVRGRLPGNQEGEGTIASHAELRSKWNTLSERWSQYLAGLTPEALAVPVGRVSTSSGFGKRLVTSRQDVLLHVCLHAHYTAAQVVNMLRQLGAATLPETMMITLARRERGLEHGAGPVAHMRVD